ncbi:MAG: hypothetical protein QM764_18585 [Chitinophagaceae bacterium]
MSFTDKQLIAAYSKIIESWSDENKLELIENLSKSLKKEKNMDKSFYKSFGAFASEKSPREIIRGIRAGRKFRKKEIRF